METRVYPYCCQSSQCGRTECEGCPAKPQLDEFKAWVAKTGATRPDPIWDPSIWTATRKKGD